MDIYTSILEEIELLSNINELKQKMHEYNLLGIERYNQGLLDEAEVYLEFSNLGDFIDYDKLYNLGTTYLKNRKFKDALTCFSVISNFTPDNELRLFAQDYMIQIIKYNEGKGIQTNTNQKQTFLHNLLLKLLESLLRTNTPNLDYDRYTNEELIHLYTPYNINREVTMQLTLNLKRVQKLFLSVDEISQKLLIDIFAYRILGPRHITLPLNTDFYWSEREYIRTLINQKESINIAFKNWKLYQHDLTNLGIPIKMYLTSAGIHSTFISKQYEYNNIKASKGDIVIDAGGCFGDTALYFANRVGEEGKVYTFEFVKSNIDIMNTNINLSPNLIDIIKIVENPIWDKSNEVLYYIDAGPGSVVKEEKISENKVLTLSIDDLVKNENLEKVDFIKMDIEGAELSALKGAKNTLIKFQPKLAISIYHSIEEFGTIFDYISSLNLGYKFYLGHFTTFSEETVLFAEVNK